jgi:alkylation response protein AidB-like acyl-CoA dehydrogenase
MTVSQRQLAACPSLSESLSQLATGDPAESLARLVEQGVDRLPLPGRGQTLARWRALAEVGAHDLGLAKLFEGHTDALAILAELGAPAPLAGSIWATWAAEPPDARPRLTHLGDGRVLLDGDKAWCSGAEDASHGLMTAWDERDRQQLVSFDLRQAGITREAGSWQAVGMASSRSIRLHLSEVVGQLVGRPGEYTGRPGFWHGGAGVAACWLGAAQWLGEYLRRHCTERADPHRRAHLGSVHVVLQGAANSVRALAEQIDASPTQSHQLAVMQVRLQVEAACDAVMSHVGRALGATPYCTDAHFAHLMADLPVFLRQSHAERELAGLGDAIATLGAPTWTL